MDEENEDGFWEEIEDIEQRFGDISAVCRGNGNCKLFQNKFNADIICSVCDAKFQDEIVEEVEEEEIEDDLDKPEFLRPPLSAMLDEDHIRTKSAQEMQMNAIEERLEILDKKVDVLIEFLQKNVKVEPLTIEHFDEHDPPDLIVEGAKVEGGKKISREEVIEYIKMRFPEITRLDMDDRQLVILKEFAVRMDVNKHFRTRFKNKGIEKMIKEIRECKTQI